MPTDTSPAIDEHDLQLVARQFQIGDIESVSYLPTGLMNRNWKITTRNGSYALKQIVDVALPTARRNLHIVEVLHQRGMPTCPPVLTRAGDPVLETESRGYCLLPWFDGTHPAGGDLTHAQASELGTTVARIHQVLNDLDPQAGLPLATNRPSSRTVHPDEAITEAHRYRAAAATTAGPFDLAVIALLDERIALLDKHGASRPADDHPRGPYGWTHGDVQYRNVLWHRGHVGAVIDWDRIRIRPYAEEIARTATIQFGTPTGLDLPRIAAFVAGYRTIVPIDTADLADGVHRLWWKRMSDFWHLDFHYDRNDHGCDDLFISGEAVLHWWTDNQDDVQDAFATRP